MPASGSRGVPAGSVKAAEPQAPRGRFATRADEPAALGRVATRVAEEAPLAELFGVVAEEVAGVLGGGVASAVLRYGPGDTATVVAVAGEPPPDDLRVGATLPAAAIDRRSGTRCGLGCPILVHGREWGAVALARSGSEPFAAGTERRIAPFAALVATAIANAESGAELRLRAEEQAALRRVATLVARGVPADELLTAVAHEIAVNAPIEGVHIYRYEPEGDAVLLAAWTTLPAKMPPGTRHPLGGHNIPTLVYRTGRPARMDDMAEVTGTPAAVVRRLGLRSVVGCPIVVDGRLWGVVVAATAQAEPIPADTEQRIAGFTELVATAIANADSRAQLAASRARVVAAATEERRRIVRDLHDGAQQRLVHAAITLQWALRELERQDGPAQGLIREALEHTSAATSELRELVQGILPRVLTHGGLRAGIDALAARSTLRVTVDVGPERYPSPIEATAYFVVSEALTNADKHAGAQSVHVTAGVADGRLRVEVRDDGRGGADPAGGSGLTGLRDRVEALGGEIEIASPPGAGTSLVVRIPIEPA